MFTTDRKGRNLYFKTFVADPCLVLIIGSQIDPSVLMVGFLEYKPSAFRISFLIRISQEVDFAELYDNLGCANSPVDSYEQGLA